jgi:hypothetical protein
LDNYPVKDLTQDLSIYFLDPEFILDAIHRDDLELVR